MDSELITVWRGAQQERAIELQRLLEANDFEAFVTPSQDASDAAFSEWLVMTPPDQASHARRVVEHSEGALDGEDDILDDRVWRQWPRCASCNARRITWCQFCSSMGSDFPAADGGPQDDESELLLCCHVCDEPFEPEFYRICHECGADFGDGVDAPHERDVDLANPRVHLMVGVLLVGSIAAFAYYWFALR